MRAPEYTDLAPGRCPTCGAVPAAAAAPPAASAQVDPGTHCEWCGAEYELPEGPPAAEAGAATGLGLIGCCIDDSEASQDAAAVAAMLRGLAPGRLALIHVAPPDAVLRGGLSPWPIDDGDPFRPPREWLEQRAAGLPAAQTVLLSGAMPGESLVDWAHRADPDLMVVASHAGRLGRAVLGSVARTVAEKAPCDVLAVRGMAPGALRHVACCIDDDEGSRRALALARRVAALAGARLTLVHAIAPAQPLAPDLPVSADRRRTAEELLRGLAGPGEETEILTGDPAPTVCEWARSSDADLLVVSPLASALSGLGGFAAALAGAAPRPVLIARGRPR